MHFFIDHTLLPTQVAADAYGPDVTNPTTQYNVSAKFMLTAPAKAFACEAGMLVVQQSDVDASLVNVIIEPTSAQSTVNHKVKYYIYRGILKSSLIDGANITAKNNSNNDLIKRIYNARLEVDLYTAGVLGYDSTLFGTQNINEIFKSSNIELNPIKVNEGEWFGQFAPLFSCGFEIILEPDKIEVNLNFVRQGLSSINITGLTGLALRAKKDTILAFIDPAAFFGLYHKEGLNITTYTVANETTPSTPITIKKKETELYTDILSKFFTQDRTYLDIRSDKGYSYDFYQDYNFITLNNNPIAQKYETQGWPIIYQNNILSLSLKLRTDGNVKPIIYIEQKQLINEEQKTPFIDDLIDSLNTGWTKDIILTPPFKPYYIQFYYYHQIIDQASLSPFIKNNRYYDHAFCSLDLLPNDFESPTLKNKEIENSNPVFISESLQKNGTGGFAYKANNGAYWDNNKVLFYATLQAQYKSSGKKYPNPAKTRKLDIANNAYTNEVGSVLQINTRLYANNLEIGPHEENIKLLNIGSCEANGAKDQNACLFLGLSIAETAAIKTTANGLSQYHQRYIYLAPESTNTPTFFTLHSNDTPIPLYQYQVKIQGLDANGNLAYLIPSKPGAPVGTPILVYSIDQFFYHSKAFSENEEPTHNSNQAEFHIYHNGTIKADTLLPGHIGKKVKYIYHDKNNIQHTICELVLSQIDGVQNGKKGIGKKPNFVPYTEALIPPNATIKYGIPGETTLGTYHHFPNKDIWVTGSHGTIFYKSTGKKTYMVRFSEELTNQVVIGGKPLRIKINTERLYVNPKVFAAFLGAAIDTIKFQHIFNGSAYSNGSCYWSVSHSNGLAFDMRYQHFLPNFKNWMDITVEAKEDNQSVIDAMRKFHLQTVYVGLDLRYYELKKVTHIDGHNDHIHFGSFDYSIK